LWEKRSTCKKVKMMGVFSKRGRVIKPTEEKVEDRE